MKSLLIVGAMALVAGCGSCERCGSVAGGAPAPEEPFGFMTYNIKCCDIPFPKDLRIDWGVRSNALFNVIRSRKPDLVGLQEVIGNHLTDIPAAFPEYGFSGAGRNARKGDSVKIGEGTWTLWRKDRFELLGEDAFMVNHNWNRLDRWGWNAIDSEYPRVCNWVHLKDKKTGRDFFHFNTHLDGSTNQLKIICARIGAIAGRKPVILNGDFNAIEKEPVIAMAKRGFDSAFDIAEKPLQGSRDTHGCGCIDYVLTSKDKARVHAVEICRDTHLVNGKPATPSDHCAIYAKISFDPAAPAATPVDLHAKTLTKVKVRGEGEGEKVKVRGEGEERNVELVRDGKPTFAIVVDIARELCGRGNSRPSATPAARVLADAFKKCTGVQPPVIDIRKPEDWMLYPKIIWVGDTPAARKAGFDMEKMPDQQLAVATTPDGLCILGYDTINIPGWNRGPSGTEYKGVGYGTLWAAYDFCERILGIRYYFMGDGTVYPKVKDLVLKPFAYTSEPYFTTRGNPYGVHCSYQRLTRQTALHPATGASSVGWRYLEQAWRMGGTAPLAGKHTPDPEPMAKRYPDKLDTVFYRSPNGKLWYSKSNYFENYFNPVDLGFADILVDCWKEVFDSKGKKALPGLGGGMVNDTYINFGVSDVLLSPADYISDPIVRREKLVTEEDLTRPDTTRSAMANVYGRFYCYLCDRLAKELPGKTLFALLYYNSKWAPTRYKLPKNFDGIVCDGSLLGWIKSPKTMEGSRALFKGWYDAMGGRPPSMAYIYGAGDPFFAAVNPAWAGDIPKVLGPYLGRLGLFFDSDMDWRLFSAYYCCAKAQWDPDFDVQAALDEMWERLYGAEAAVPMRAFQRTLYTAVADAMCGKPGVTAKVVDELERLLAEAEAKIPAGGVEMRRFVVFKDWWPQAFKNRRAQFNKKKPLGLTDMPRRWSEKIDWSKVPAIPNTPNLKLVWDEDGLHGSADDAFDVTIVADEKKGLKHRIKYDTRVPGFTITYDQFGKGVKPQTFRTWTAEGCGKLRFACRGEYPKKKGMTGETLGFKSGEIQTMITPGISYTIANEIRPWTFNFSKINARPWTYGCGTLGPGVHGFGCYSAFFRMTVNGIPHHDIQIDLSVCEKWEEGDKRGWKTVYNFDGAMVDVIFYMKPDSPKLFGYVQPSAETLVPVKSCKVELSGIPSDVPQRRTPPTEPAREIVTATRMIKPPAGNKQNHTIHKVTPDDRWFLLRDAILDGTPGKGIGPCWIGVDFAEVEKSSVAIGTARDIVFTFDLKSGFKRFGFALWEDRARAHTNDEALEIVKKLK